MRWTWPSRVASSVELQGAGVLTRVIHLSKWGGRIGIMRSQAGGIVTHFLLFIAQKSFIFIDRYISMREASSCPSEK